MPVWSNLKERLDRGEAVYGTMVRFVRDPGIANVVANAGFDFMFVDMEHSTYSFETVADTIRVARGCSIPVIVRPPARLSFYMSRLLDAGANGLMLPMTETQEHAQEIQKACYYSPLGLRGCAGLLGQTDFEKIDAQESCEKANQNNLIVAQVESRCGVENIEAIVSTEGIDAVIIGPHDLSNSLGVVGQINHERVTEAIEQVFQACQKHNKPSGIHTGSLEQLHYWRRRGMQLLGYLTDMNVLHAAYNAHVKSLRDSTAP